MLFRSVRRRRDIRAEGARLLDRRGDLVTGDGDHVGDGIERRADVAVFAVGREDRHARTVRNDDPRLLFVSRAVKYRDVVLAADDHPYLTAIRRIERFVRRATDISYVLHTIGRSIDEVHRVRTDRDNSDGAMIGRKPHAVHQQLALVERTEIGRQRIAKADGANELVVDGIGDGNGVRELFGGIDSILMADGNVGIGSGRGRLSGGGVAGTDKTCRERENN